MSFGTVGFATFLIAGLNFARLGGVRDVAFAIISHEHIP